jgi:hypothetical protein
MTKAVSKPLVMLIVLAVVGALAVLITLRQDTGTFGERWENGGRIITVGPKDNLQTAINAAQSGDTIVVQAGAISLSKVRA